MTGRQLLIDRRVELGMTREEVARRMGCAMKTYARWEQGDTTPRPGQRPALARILKWSMSELSAAINPDRATRPGGHTVPEWLDTYISLEQGATRIWAFEPLVIPGLLQTREYARAVEASDPVPHTPDAIAQRVELRIVRQGVLSREPRPLRLSTVLDESALHRLAGSREVMARQLTHLAGTAANNNIDIRVLPFDAGVFAAAFGAFSLMSSSREMPTMAFVVNRTGVSYLNRKFEIDAHMALFEHLSDMALTPSASIEKIRTIAKERYHA